MPSSPYTKPKDLNPLISEYVDAMQSKFPFKDLPTPLFLPTHIPVPQDRSSIESQLLACETDLLSIGKEIRNLRSVTSTLEARYSSYRTYKAYLQSLLSHHINKFPNEILMHIFAYVSYRDTRYEDSDYVNILGHEGPEGNFWTIQCVCRHWRTIVHSTPSLWRKFEVPDMLYADSGIQPHVAALRIQLCLEKSGVMPLTISLRPRNCDTVPVSVMEDIARHCDRWEDIEVDGIAFGNAEQKTDIREIIRSKGLPKLRRILIDGYFTSSVRDGDFPFDLFKDAPGVNEVHLYYAILPEVDAFPWTNVRKLILEKCDIPSENALSSVLNAMPSLEEFVWSRNRMDIGAASLLVRVPSLRTLTIGRISSPDLAGDVDSDDEDDPLPLPQIQIPNVTKLRIEGHIREYGSLLSIISSSRSGIKVLEMERTTFDYVLQVAKQFPEIDELKIENVENVEGRGIQPFLRQFLSRSAGDDRNAFETLPLLKKLDVESPEQYTKEIFDLWMGVMRARKHTTEVTQGRNHSVSCLSWIGLSGAVSWHEENIRAHDQLLRLAGALGIKVELGIHRIMPPRR